MLCLLLVSNPVRDYRFNCRSSSTHAIMFTLFPPAFSAMLSASLCARASMLPEGGTAATITSIPLRESASVIPRQYCIPGRKRPASRSSSKPRRPWARIRVCFCGNRQRGRGLRETVRTGLSVQVRDARHVYSRVTYHICLLARHTRLQ